MWGPMPLMTVSTVVMTVWLSAEVVHIPHESWSSLLAGYSLYRWASLQTSRVCARTSLQGYSMVSPSLQHNHWGFTGGVSTYHQGPLLHRVALRRIHSFTHSFPTRRIPRESTQSAPPVGATTHENSTTYYITPYLYRLMVVPFSWLVAPWTGP
jgi:hypothetical protein